MRIVHYDSFPSHIIDARKHVLYLEMRKQRDMFLKSLRSVRHGDWLIEKRLLEAGGIGKTVYILPARGGGTTITSKVLNDLIKEGRDVTIYSPPTYDDWKKRAFLLNPTYGITHRKGVKE